MRGATESDASDDVEVAVENGVEEEGCAEESPESDGDVPSEEDGKEDVDVDVGVGVGVDESAGVEVDVEVTEEEGSDVDVDVDVDESVRVEIDVEIAEEEGSEEEYVENVNVKDGADEAGEDVEDVAEGSMSGDGGDAVPEEERERVNDRGEEDETEVDDVEERSRECLCVRECRLEWVCV